MPTNHHLEMNASRALHSAIQRLIEKPQHNSFHFIAHNYIAQPKISSCLVVVTFVNTIYYPQTLAPNNAFGTGTLRGTCTCTHRCLDQKKSAQNKKKKNYAIRERWMKPSVRYTKKTYDAVRRRANTKLNERNERESNLIVQRSMNN